MHNIKRAPGEADKEDEAVFYDAPFQHKLARVWIGAHAWQIENLLGRADEESIWRDYTMGEARSLVVRRRKESGLTARTVISDSDLMRMTALKRSVAESWLQRSGCGCLNAIQSFPRMNSVPAVFDVCPAAYTSRLTNRIVVSAAFLSLPA